VYDTDRLGVAAHCASSPTSRLSAEPAARTMRSRLRTILFMITFMDSRARNEHECEHCAPCVVYFHIGDDPENAPLVQALRVLNYTQTAIGHGTDLKRHLFAGSLCAGKFSSAREFILLHGRITWMDARKAIIQLRAQGSTTNPIFALSLITNPVWHVLSSMKRTAPIMHSPNETAATISPPPPNMQCSDAMGVRDDHQGHQKLHDSMDACLQLWEDLVKVLDWVGAADDGLVLTLRRLGLHTPMRVPEPPHHQRLWQRHASLRVVDVSLIHSTQRVDWIWYRRARPHPCVAGGEWRDVSNLTKPRYVLTEALWKRMKYGTGKQAECAIYNWMHHTTSPELEWQVSPSAYCPEPPPRPTDALPRKSANWRLDAVDYCTVLTGLRVLFVGDSLQRNAFIAFVMLVTDGDFSLHEKMELASVEPIRICNDTASVAFMASDLLWSKHESYPEGLPIMKSLLGQWSRNLPFLRNVSQYDVLFAATGNHWAGKRCDCAGHRKGRGGKMVNCQPGPSADLECLERGYVLPNNESNFTENSFASYKARQMSTFHKIAIDIRTAVAASASPVKVFYRTPTQHHTGCTGKSLPSSTPYVRPAGDRFGADEMDEVADTFFEAFEAVMGPRQVGYVDARQLSERRFDRHRALIEFSNFKHTSTDCLHYCTPSVLDDWNDVFIRQLWEALIRSRHNR
jgi:hypothetical protein